MTRAVFDEQMLRLEGLHFRPRDLDAYYDDLQTIPEAVFTAAVTLAWRTRTAFPLPAELRADCDQVAPRIDPGGPAPPPSGGRERWFDCDVCRDTGWREGPAPTEGPSQPWVRRCACYGTNPTIQRRLQARASYAEQAVPAGTRRRR